jgi:hypothetical protein
MKAGFRGWLYRWISAGFGIVGVVVFLSLTELSRFYGFPNLAPTGEIGLAVSFLLLLSAFLKVWSWKRYAILCVVAGLVFGLPYLALRPEMLRDDVLKQLTNPPLTVDLLFYRGWALRNDPERDVKIERLQFIYGFVNTYGGNKRNSPPETPPTLIPEAK